MLKIQSYCSTELTTGQQLQTGLRGGAPGDHALIGDLSGLRAVLIIIQLSVTGCREWT